MRFPSCILALLLTGCSLVPHYIRPETETPQQWATQPSAVSTSTDLDWNAFGSAQLPALVRIALMKNQDIEAAAARIDQARAEVRIAGGALYPTIDASANASRATNKVSGFRSTHEENYRAGLDVAYEVDLWGRIGANHEAAKARFEASRFDYATISITTATETARNYLAWVATQAQWDVAQHNTALAQDLLTIVNVQFKEGRISALEVAQQDVVLQNAQSSVAAIEKTRDAYRDALAVLCAVPASTFSLDPQNFAAITTPLTALIQPAELIARRPDIASREASLRAANFDVGAARAALFPSLTIGADAGLAANPTTLATDLLASLSVPVFHGGALAGAVELSEAQRRELIADYRQAVLISFQETQDALSLLKSSSQREINFKAATVSSARAYELAKLQYIDGAIDFQTLLTTQQSLFSAQNSALQAKLDTLSATLDLFQALGGNATTPEPQSE